MKKIYLNPTIDVVEIDVKNQILAGSVPGAEGGGSDGGLTPTNDDPGSDDWGNKF